MCSATSASQNDESTGKKLGKVTNQVSDLCVIKEGDANLCTGDQEGLHVHPEPWHDEGPHSEQGVLVCAFIRELVLVQRWRGGHSYNHNE